MANGLEALAREVGEALQRHRLKLATAESCTGGWVSKEITGIAGSSAWFDRGFVTYSDDAKRDLLGVDEATLKQYGAVSEATVREMATGTLAQSRAEVALSISGIAGPGGGTPQKPVGSVCFGWALREGGLRSESVRFGGDRDAVRAQAVEHALRGVLRLLADRDKG